MNHTRLSPTGRFGPLTADHPGVGTPCVLCGASMEVGQAPALYGPLRPSNDEERAKEAAGRAFTGEADLGHEVCPAPPGYEQASTGPGLAHYWCPDSAAFDQIVAHARRVEQQTGIAQMVHDHSAGAVCSETCTGFIRHDPPGPEVVVTPTPF